ncbi:RyR domain [uncultured Clostridium sp.]|nr:RyR domain [uncultured Clostridium sp.]
MAYDPKPMDTRDVALGGTLCRAIEDVARNIHEVWAQGRMAEGWRYGQEYDGERKLHPSLIPYEQLPESEKDVDRATVTQTVKMLLKMGYEIKKKEDGDGGAF